MNCDYEDELRRGERSQRRIACSDATRDPSPLLPPSRSSARMRARALLEPTDAAAAARSYAEIKKKCVLLNVTDEDRALIAKAKGISDDIEFHKD